MQLSYKSLGLAVIAAGVVVIGAFMLGKQQGGQKASSPEAAPKAAAPTAAPAQAPVHSQALVTPTEGKVAPPPADERYSHFRIGNANVKAIFAEGKTVWVGTSRGVIRYDTAADSYKVFNATNGLLSNGVFYVGRVRGQLTVGTYGGGMSILNESDGTWRNYNVPQGMGDAFIYDVLEAKNGDIWIATWSGVNRVKGGALDDRSQWELYTVENTAGGVPNDWVYGLAEGKNGDIWLATEGGLALWRGGKWENWNHARGLGAPYEKVKEAIQFKNDPSKQSVHHAKQKEEMGLQQVDIAYNPNYIVSLKVDADGVVWAGTWGGGLARYDGKAWTNYTHVEGLPANHVFMLHIDPKGQMWVGTSAGMVKLENGKFTSRMTTEHGLFGNDVFSMASVGDGTIWVGSYGGVSRIRVGS